MNLDTHKSKKTTKINKTSAKKVVYVMFLVYGDGWSMHVGSGLGYRGDRRSNKQHCNEAETRKNAEGNVVVVRCCVVVACCEPIIMAHRLDCFSI